MTSGELPESGMDTGSDEGRPGDRFPDDVQPEDATAGDTTSGDTVEDSPEAAIAVADESPLPPSPDDAPRAPDPDTPQFREPRT